MIFGFSYGLALPLGLITGVLSLIPMFGSFIGGALVALLLAMNSLWAGIIFIIYTIIYLQVEANVVSPKIQSKGMRLPALLVLSAVTIGVYMFGLIGAIVAIPIAGCIKVLVEEYGVGDVVAKKE
jgi:predicted PurR-regulated permease PerM